MWHLSLWRVWWKSFSRLRSSLMSKSRLIMPFPGHPNWQVKQPGKIGLITWLLVKRVQLVARQHGSRLESCRNGVDKGNVLLVACLIAARAFFACIHVEWLAFRIARLHFVFLFECYRCCCGTTVIVDIRCTIDATATTATRQTAHIALLHLASLLIGHVYIDFGRCLRHTNTWNNISGVSFLGHETRQLV